MAAGDSAAATAHTAAQTACTAALYTQFHKRAAGLDPLLSAAFTATNAAITASASGTASLVTTNLAKLNAYKVFYTTVQGNVRRRRYLRMARHQHKLAALIHTKAP